MKLILKCEGHHLYTDSEEYSCGFIIATSPVKIEADGEDITSKIGETIYEEYIIRNISIDSLGGGFLTHSFDDDIYNFKVSIDIDCDEFDPSKISLIHSGYDEEQGEFDDVPAGILGNVVNYDGELYYDLCPDY